MLINFDLISETVIPNMRGGKGHEHSLMNDSEGALTFFAAVPEHGA